MPNQLTGDFSAVLELSSSTIDRLLASLHQSSGSPHLPHDAFIRVGDSSPINGVVGAARAQISAPRVELIDRSVDRVAFGFWLRVWYVPDPYSTALPEFIYGQVRAEYGLVVRELKPGPHSRGGAYGYLGVIPGSVSFKSAGPDHSADAQITQQLDSLLSQNYVPSPSPLMEDFKQHRFKSLVQSAGAAVAHPLTVSAAETGSMASIQQVFLSGKDFAVAVSREYIMSLVESSLATIRGTALPGTTVTVKSFGFTVASTTYTPVITDAQASWSPGAITLTITGGANSSGSWLLPDRVDFTITQGLTLGFNPTTEALTVTPSGAPNVGASVSGAFGGLAKNKVKSAISSAFNSVLTVALNQLQPQLQKLTEQKFKLMQQLQHLDPAASVKLETADFTGDGIILRGSITVSPRTPMKLWFGKLAGRPGYSAFLSWVPGGRVTDYHWRWELDNPPDPTSGKEAHADRFLLLEDRFPLPAVPPPQGSKLPLRPGSVCLVVRGVTLNPVTGAEQAVDSTTVIGLGGECQHFVP